jgi:hypothetical protein
MSNQIVGDYYLVLEVKFPFDFVLEGDGVFDGGGEAMVFLVCIEFAFEDLLYSCDSVLQHADEIFHRLLKGLLEVEGEDGVLKLLVGTGRVPKNLPDVLDEFLESDLVAGSGQHGEELQLDRLAQPVQLDGHVVVRTHDYLLLAALGGRVEIVVQRRQLVDLLDGLVDYHEA